MHVCAKLARWSIVRDIDGLRFWGATGYLCFNVFFVNWSILRFF